MSDWSSFEKDKAYTDQWRTFLTEKKLPKEQEEAINEGFIEDLFKSAEAKDTNAAEVLDDFQQAFVDIFNKIKKRLHPDLLDDINNLEMPSDKEVAATKAPPPAADTPAADAAEDNEEPETRVAAESIDRITNFVELLEAQRFAVGARGGGIMRVPLGDRKIEQLIKKLVLLVGQFIQQQSINEAPRALRQLSRPEPGSFGTPSVPTMTLPLSERPTAVANFIDDKIASAGAQSKQIVKLEKVLPLIVQLDSKKLIGLSTFLRTKMGDDEITDLEAYFTNKDNLEKFVVTAKKMLSDLSTVSQAKAGQQGGKEGAADQQQLTSFSHFFDLYYSTRFGSIPSSGNKELRSKIIRQLASLLKKDKADDTVLGMFTYLNRIYKQRARNLGRSETGQDTTQPGETPADNVIYLDEQPPQGYEKQSSPFKNYLMQEADLSEDEVAPIIDAFKQDLIDAKFVVKEAVKAKLSRTIEAINQIEEEKRVKVKNAFKQLLSKYELSPESDKGNLFFSMNDDGAASDDDEGEGEGEGEGGTVIQLEDFRQIVNLSPVISDHIKEEQHEGIRKELSTVIDYIKGNNNSKPDSLTEQEGQEERLISYLKESEEKIKKIILNTLSTIGVQGKAVSVNLNMLFEEIIGTKGYNFDLAVYILSAMCFLVNREDTEATRLLKLLFDKNVKTTSESISYDRMRLIAGIK